MRSTLYTGKVLLFLTLAFVSCCAFTCSDGQVQQATLAEHDFKTSVQGFQNAEIAEFNAGHVPPDLHAQIQTAIQKIAQSAVEADKAIAAGDKNGAQQWVSQISASVANLLKEGVIPIPNATTRAALQVALQAVSVAVDNFGSNIGS